ncbi:MAG: FGGY-family carbohydrate kinase [Gammaproteobacteria bacterium]|nr:FGGY-family carbohydrate kinase [Gammaproteobacteria bacterium]MCP5136939.1 FGGY-family carbohydrate kinase [Gammaproteobacteria bacterium]
MRISGDLFLGIDIGTSGVRATVIDALGNTLAWRRQDFIGLNPPGEQDPQTWWDALDAVLTDLAGEGFGSQIAAIGLDATSGTVLAIDTDNAPLAPALMYNNTQASEEAARVAAVAPRQSAAHGASSGLAKRLYLHTQIPNAECVSQADWILRQLGAEKGHSDHHNMLKWGWDPITRSWPDWLTELNNDTASLPQVHAPGTPIAHIDAQRAARFDLNPDCLLCAATTDSNAAFIATGAHQLGDAVTSLGSTLVTKVLSARPVFAPQFGVYSHLVGDLWLVGGSSNTGGAVLKQHFCPGEIQALSLRVNPQRRTNLDYYPLPGIGERFPINDPDLMPRLSPRPDDDLTFFQGMLEGIARIEQRAYRLLEQLGAPYPRCVRSAGGGAHNKPWADIRQQMLGVPMHTADQEEAAYGSALLAANAIINRA